ncbi:MAG TPA: pyridoxal phosphate-dependent aminotransferase family protein, partial [Bacteroidia bacterium]|nr:pyridoxal phosphate-dependent aminotransferase family protein [Bacteroidia bacterium]
MLPAEKALSEALLKREEHGSLRKLSLIIKEIDFCSNDYLGFARSEVLHQMILKEEAKSNITNGSGGSRLLTGNSEVAAKLEEHLALIHHVPAVLLFNSGYDTNIGLFSSVPGKDDTIIYDELVHASIHDGIRLSRAQSFPFRHNDLVHLKERIEKAKGNIFVAVESVYSMDGDIAPLNEITELCSSLKSNLIVDEAHATGVFNMGLVQQLKLQDKVFARIHTFGKALGCHGAIVAGSKILKQYLVNYARSFIYTTALPLHSIISIDCAYRFLGQNEGTVKKLQEIIKYFRQTAYNQKETNGKWIDSSSAIQSLLVPGNENVKKLALAIQEHNIDVRPIMSPTVPRGKERIRICLHAYNTKS